MRTVVVTGISRGLGAALFDQLHRRGDRVVGIGRSFTDRQRRLATDAPDRVALHEADLADPAAVPGAGDLARLLGQPDEVALVHNAGVVEPIGAVGTLPPERLVSAVSLNLTAPLLLTNALLATVPTAARLRVLFVSSGAAQRVIGGWAVYSATKRGGEMFFEALAEQYADDPRVTVASVNPGVMDTGMQRTIRAAATDSGYFPDRERFLGLHARGELPGPTEVAQRIIAEHLEPTVTYE